MTRSITRIIVLFAGVLYTLTGLALLFAPEWFYQNIGTYPPYNRHYEGDLGTVQLPIGIGLLLISWDPSRHRALLGVVAIASLLHAFNHVYDSLAEQANLAHWLFDTVPLLLFAVLLIFAYYVSVTAKRSQVIGDSEA